MRRLLPVLAVAALAAAILPAFAQEATIELGGDHYAAGQTIRATAPMPRDALMAGYDVTLDQPVGGDAHLAGFSVAVPTTVSGDLYAAGFNVNISGAVDGDITAFGNSVTVQAPAPVGGNVRLGGAAVVLGGPVAGSALVSARSLNLSSVISGDLTFFGETVTFAPGATVAGTVSINAPNPIAVPGNVAPPERVLYQQVQIPDYATEAGRTAEQAVKGVWPAVWGTALWSLFLFIVAAVLIALLPRTAQALKAAADNRPMRLLGVGFLTFAATLGLVPVTAMTLIGIFLLPVVLVLVAVAWSLAYLAGVYLIGLRVARSFVTIDTKGKELGILAISLVAVAVVGMIPVIGWLLTLAVAIAGFGAAGLAIFARAPLVPPAAVKAPLPAGPLPSVA
jgi:cytoskeletal protein CcmA (bactofilin family)